MKEFSENDKKIAENIESIDKDSVIASLQSDLEHSREKIAFLRMNSFTMHDVLHQIVTFLIDPKFLTGYLAGVIVLSFCLVFYH